jgi:two-component sensor histidine kinase
VLATVIDITERKRVQDSQRLIVRELQHRTRNLFGVFQAIAARTVDESRTAAEIKYILSGRIQALERAYDMLADAAWEGASLAMILDRQFSGFSNRVNLHRL